VAGQVDLARLSAVALDLGFFPPAEWHQTLADFADQLGAESVQVAAGVVIPPVGGI
jgi:hypothetical protein